MYPFNKVQQEDRSWIFELDGINMIIDGFELKNNKHWIKNPQKAIAFFSIDGNLYGLSNIVDTRQTAEDFFDIMSQQYSYFNTDPVSERFFSEHGFIMNNDNWHIDLVDHLGIHHQLKYRPSAGWYYNDSPLKRQPDNIGDLMHLYTEKTGEVLKRVS